MTDRENLWNSRYADFTGFFQVKIFFGAEIFTFYLSEFSFAVLLPMFAAFTAAHFSILQMKIYFGVPECV